MRYEHKKRKKNTKLPVLKEMINLLLLFFYIHIIFIENNLYILKIKK